MNWKSRKIVKNSVSKVIRAFRFMPFPFTIHKSVYHECSTFIGMFLAHLDTIDIYGV